MRKFIFPLILVMCSCSVSDKKPNILFIFSDDHTTQAISAYGDGRIETPNLDKLAAEGILFENCFCTNSICAPSRAVVLTGKYSHLNGVRDNSTDFDGSQQTFPKLLQDAGYRTALIGKWHLKSEPTGFDYWEVLPGQGEYVDPEFIEMSKRIQKTGYVTDIITDDALAWLNSYDYDQPFCLMVQHKAPHANWEWPDELKDEFVDDFPLPDNFWDNYDGRSEALAHSVLKVGTFQWNFHYRYRFGDYPYSNPEEMYQRYMHDYMRCIRSIDNNVGRLIQGLEDLGLDENTIVIYSADQGFFLGEHGLYDKRFMYEESLRMPLIMKGIGHLGKGIGHRKKGIREGISEGIRVEEMVLNLDFASTILDMAGVAVPDDMQGSSFLPLLHGETVDGWRKSMYYRFYEEAYEIGPHEGIRTERYKLIHFMYPVEAWELYDLKTDPNEMTNLAQQDKYLMLRDSLAGVMTGLKTQYEVKAD